MGSPVAGSSSRRNIPLLEARDEDGLTVNPSDSNYTKTMVGAGTAPFYLVFAEDWFADGRLFAVVIW